MLGSWDTFCPDTPMQGPVDDETVRGAAAGDEIATARIDAAFRPRLEHQASQSGLPAEDGRDLAQDVLIDVFRQLRAGSFRQESSFGTWVYAIARHKIIEYWRKQGRLQRLHDGARSTLPQAASSPEQAVIVAQALEMLPRREAVILVLSRQEGRTLEEIGEMVGLKKSRVDELLQSAKLKFAAIILTGKEPPHIRPKDESE
jgi:RNA polymerase sigma factor (sigma-70 family)